MITMSEENNLFWGKKIQTLELLIECWVKALKHSTFTTNKTKVVVAVLKVEKARPPTYELPPVAATTSATVSCFIF